MGTKLIPEGCSLMPGLENVQADAVGQLPADRHPADAVARGPLEVLAVGHISTAR